MAQEPPETHLTNGHNQQLNMAVGQTAPARITCPGGVAPGYDENRRWRKSNGSTPLVEWRSDCPNIDDPNWPKAKITIARGNAPGTPTTQKPIWPKAIVNL